MKYIILTILLFSGCVPVKRKSSRSERIEAVLSLKVVEKDTGKPVERAVAFLGRGDIRCHTDQEGRCKITGLEWGDYSLGVYKKGFFRFEKLIHLKKGKNFFSVELEKMPTIPVSFTVEGIVEKKILLKGTRSENTVYKLRKDNGDEEFLFDEVGENRNFDWVAGKRVRITGYRGIGFWGWQHQKVKGIYVERIEVE